MKSSALNVDFEGTNFWGSHPKNLGEQKRGKFGVILDDFRLWLRIF